MRHGVRAFLCLIVFSPFADAQTLDKAKFRQAIEMPAIATLMGVHFRSNERDGRGNLFDPLQKIAELQKKMTGGPEDAETLLEQRAVYLECMRQDKEAPQHAKEKLQKAELLLKPYVNSNDPRHAVLLTFCGAILEATAESPWNECETLARRAVAAAPNEWRAWTYLAHVRQLQIPTILCGGNDKLLSRETRAQEAIGMLYLKQVRPEHAAEAERALNEALQCHDRAKQLAPNEAKRQTLRYGFRLTEVVLRNAFARYRGQDAPYRLQQIERVVLDELEDAARLQPDHLLWQSQLVHHLVILGWQVQADADRKKAEEAKKTPNAAPPKDDKADKKFKAARSEDLMAIRTALGNIEKLADSSQGETSAFCHTILAALYSSMQENDVVEKHARKVLQIDAKNQLAGEQLQQALLLQKRYADQLVVAEIVAKNNKSARNCYLLAKAQAFNQRYDLAENACLTGLRENGTDLYCLMGLSALLMRKGDDAETLRTVSEFLEKARHECRPDVGPLAHAELAYLMTVHQALSGEVAIARLKLHYMQKEHPDNARYEKLLSAFGR